MHNILFRFISDTDGEQIELATKIIRHINKSSSFFEIKDREEGKISVSANMAAD